MSKTEYYWVIQRDDGRFFVRNRKVGKVGNKRKNIFSDSLKYAFTDFCESYAQASIKIYKLQNCRPVKVKILIVGEDDE